MRALILVAALALAACDDGYPVYNADANATSSHSPCADGQPVDAETKRCPDQK